MLFRIAFTHVQLWGEPRNSYTTFWSSFHKLLPLWDLPHTFWVLPKSGAFIMLFYWALLMPISGAGWASRAHREKKAMGVYLKFLDSQFSDWRGSFTSFYILGACAYCCSHHYGIDWVQKYGGKGWGRENGKFLPFPLSVSQKKRASPGVSTSSCYPLLVFRLPWAQAR